MNNKIYIGIDCGLDGGIVTLDSAGNIIDQRVMPVVEIGKGRKIDLHELSDFLQMRLGKAPTIIIEQPGAHAPSAAGALSRGAISKVAKGVLVKAEDGERAEV
jgi:hypothetical protein